ncbi:von Willebrand factor type A domain protein, partial [Vibrio parahaemolyticus V-223/04]
CHWWCTTWCLHIALSKWRSKYRFLVSWWKRLARRHQKVQAS